MNKYITNKDLRDSEIRVMLIISELLIDKEYLELRNSDIGEYIGKSTSAVAKLIHNLTKKGYLKSFRDKNNRKLYILK